MFVTLCNIMHKNWDNLVRVDCLKAQSKLQFTKGKCISVNGTLDQAAKHGQAISIYFAHFETSEQITIFNVYCLWIKM